MNSSKPLKTSKPASETTTATGILRKFCIDWIMLVEMEVVVVVVVRVDGVGKG